MSNKPNAYLAQQEAIKQKMLDVGMDTGFQKCWDLFQLVLHDPKVMGKDAYGKERIKKLYWAMKEKEKDLGRAWSPTLYNDADVQQRNLDAGLAEIWGEELCPFYERYPFVKRPDYSKGNKNWR